VNITSVRRFFWRRRRSYRRPGNTIQQTKDIAMNTNIGKVTLLSAGPGDLDLLTLKAAKALAAADVVLLDDLANPGIVALAPQARVIRVGKRGGCRSTPQAFIERLMRRYALKGLHVVRVKGGEALLFGRAGEEIAFLRETGIAVDIVNGISSGFAAAAGLGISLTHRRHCHGVTFVTAHTEDHGEPDWAALAATHTTLAIYMGMRRIGKIAGALLASLPADTPAAVVQWAGGIDERRLSTRLGRLAADAADAGFDSPAVILVGNAIGESVEPEWALRDEFFDAARSAAEVAEGGVIAQAA
jgi:uroporphyrin-III C-methyltransferase